MPNDRERARSKLSEVLPWIANPQDQQHAEAADLLVNAWLRDQQFGDAVARVDWIADGIADDELEIVQYAESLSTLLIPQPATREVDWIYLPYLDDRSNIFARYDEKRLLVTLLFLLDVRANDRTNLEDLNELVQRMMLDTRVGPGFAAIASKDPRIALFIAEQAKSLQRDLLPYAIWKMGSIATKNADGLSHLEQLVEQPWFGDGLTNEEAALITILPSHLGEYPDTEQYAALLRSHFTQTEKVVTSSGREVTIWVLKNRPFDQDSDWVDLIANSVRILEEFLGVAFPTTDIVFEIVAEGSTWYPAGGQHLKTHVRLPEEYYGSGVILHEVAHYYFSYPHPDWLAEGGANFAERHIEAQPGIQITRYFDRNSCDEESVIENIMQFNRHYFYFSGCEYALGENLLISLLGIIGEDALGAALGEISLLMLDSRASRVSPITEQAIYDTFLKHTPPDLQNAFQSVYDRLHGGPTMPNAPDDHPDDISRVIAMGVETEEVAIGETAGGVLDYRFDTDLFSFKAEGGKTYRIAVAHDALRETSVWVYDDQRGDGPDSVDVACAWWRTEQSPSGPQALWVAPDSGRYFVGIENFGGHSGSYTLTINIESPERRPQLIC